MWKKRRLIGGFVQALVILGLPFLRIGGESALRFDIPGEKLLIFGTVVWVNELFVILISIIFVTLLFIVVTNLFGRVWCGWICPQMLIPELTSFIAGKLPFKRSKLTARLLLIPVTGLVSLSIIWYFIPPGEAVRQLFTSKIVGSVFVVQWLVIYLDLAIWGAGFCASICPYSMIQNVLFDRDTLVISFDESRRPCLECRLCEGVCPVGIDIKDGLQRECIACAECIDACTGITKPKKLDSFISYSGRIGRKKSFVLGTLLLAFILIGFYGSATRPKVRFNLNLVMTDRGRSINVYRYLLQNNTAKKLNLEIIGGKDVKVMGQDKIILQKFSIIEGKITLVPESKRHESTTITLKGGGIELKRRITLF